MSCLATKPRKLLKNRGTRDVVSRLFFYSGSVGSFILRKLTESNIQRQTPTHKIQPQGEITNEAIPPNYRVHLKAKT